ncbi:MAG: hypothetical protein H6Q89_3461, partial [Myxococcaceae bacterium]|nr:hypothetical protein [Myxococcaceae bacterium]
KDHDAERPEDDRGRLERLFGW